MEDVQGMDPVGNNKLPLPPISSLLAVKYKKFLRVSNPSLPPQRENTVFIPPFIKKDAPLPISALPLDRCSNTPLSSSASTCDKILTSSTTATRTKIAQPMSSPPPPPHVLCGLRNVQTFQQIPIQSQPVDASSMGPTNMPCGSNFPYQQTAFGGVNTLACQTIIYQNTSIISPSLGFKSSICNHPSAWRSTNTKNFNGTETQISPGSKRMPSRNQHPLLQNPLKPLDVRARSFQSKVVKNSQFGYVECLDHQKRAGQDAVNFTRSVPCSSQTLSNLQNSLKESTCEFRSSINRGASAVRSPVQQAKVPLSQNAENNWEKSAYKKQELEVPNPKRNSIFPTCPAFLADASSSGAPQHSNSIGFIKANSEFNLFPNRNIDEIESVGSSDLGVDNTEYHPIALPLGCFQCNDSDTESDMTCQEGSLGRRMAKMGQDKFNLHLDKTLTFIDWKLIPIQQEPISKMVSDNAEQLQMDDPRLQQPWNKNRSDVYTVDSTVSGSSGTGVVESEKKEERMVSSKAILREITSADFDECNQDIEMLGVDFSVSRIEDMYGEGPEIKENSTITENELTNSDIEQNTRIEMGSENYSKSENVTLSKAMESTESKEPTVVSVTSEESNLVQAGTDKNTIIKGSAEYATISKAIESAESKEAALVSLINKGFNPVQAATPDHLPCYKVSAENHSKRSSFSDTNDAVIGVHQSNPLTRIATVLSQNLSKTTKDKVGKNVERLSRNISCAIKKMKCSSENIAVASVASTQDHESSISVPVSYSSTNPQVTEDMFVTVNLATQCNEDDSVTGKEGCRTQILEKKELPSLWHDSKSCSSTRQEKFISNHEKRLLKESADFLGEDFNAFSRRSQRKRGVPKKLENYLSESGDVSEDVHTPVNKRKRQKTKSDVEGGYSTSDRTKNSSSWNRVYQDDVVIEGENSSTNLEVEARHQNKTNKKFSNDEDHDIGIEDCQLKSAFPCTRNMLKRLTSNLIPRSTRKRTSLRSQETQVNGSDIDENTDLSDDNDTFDNYDADSTSGFTPRYSVTLDENSNLPTKFNKGDSTSHRTTDLVTATRNKGLVTQNCTVCITREETIKEGQSLTSGDMITWTENLRSSRNSNRGSKEKTHDLTTGEGESFNVSNITRNKSKAMKKKGLPFKNLPSPMKAIGKDGNNVSSHFGKKITPSIEDNEYAITTELESAHSTLPFKLKKNSKEKMEITSLSKGKSKKSKMEKIEKSELPCFDIREEKTSIVAEVDTNQSVKKKSKHKKAIDRYEELSGSDATKPKSMKKKSHGKKKTKEKSDDGSLSKDISSACSLEQCHLMQNYDGKDTSSGKKNTLKNGSDTAQKKRSNSKGKKAFGKISNSQSNNLTKQIHNLIVKNKQRILNGYNAKFRVITNPSQGAKLMSNRPVDCRFCKKTFGFSAMKEHEREHQFKCFRCCLFFTTKKEKKEHVIKEHKISKKPRKATRVSKLHELYHCMLCEKSFHNINVFQRHLHTSVHGYNRHIQNRCLTMLGGHFHESTHTKHGTLYAIDNGAQEGEQVLQQQNKWCKAEDKSLKMWTLPENLTSIEELEKQFIKAVDSDKNVVHYYYREPEFLNVIKRQESLLQNMSALSNREEPSEEPYAVVTNFSMMKYLTARTQHSDYVTQQEAGSIQCMHNNPADCSTNYTDPAINNTNYTDPTGGSTNYLDTAGGITSYTDPPGSNTNYTDPAGNNTNCTDPTGGSTNYLDTAGGITSYTDPAGSNTNYTDPAGGSTSYTGPAGSNTNYTDPAGGSTNYTDPAGGSTSYTGPAGSSTNYTDSTVASASFIQTSSSESRSYSLPYSYSDMNTMSYCNTNQMNSYSNEITTQVVVPERAGHFAVHNNSSLVLNQSNLDDSYQLSVEGSLPDQLMKNHSRILSTSGSDHSDMDQDHGQMGWLSRAIEDIEADPYYQVHDFLDSQSDLDNDSSFNELSTSKNSPVLQNTSTPSTSTRCTVATDTRSFIDLDSGQEIQVGDSTCQKTPGHCANGTRDIFAVECLDSCQSKESGTCVLEPLNSSSSSVNTTQESQSNDTDDDPESQEMIKLKYAQILCDIRNDVLGTRSYQE